jgi:hypothetical protein
MLTNANINRLLPKPLLFCLKRFLIPQSGTPVPLSSGIGKTVLMTAQRDFCLGNSLSKVNTTEPNSSNRRTINLFPITQKKPLTSCAKKGKRGGYSSSLK